MTRFLISAIFVLTALGLQAQRGFEAGGFAGTSWYFGDLNNDLKLNSPGATIGAATRFNFDERICMKAGINYIWLRGYDYKSSNIYQQARNISFNNHMAELSGQLEMNFLTYKHGSRDNWYTPYMFVGGSVFAHSPQAYYNGSWVKLRPLGTEGQKKGSEYSITSASWLFGVGFKMDLTNTWSFNVELSSRQAFTDFLDDTHGYYADNFQIEFERGPDAAYLADPSIIIPGFNDSKIGKEGFQRGDRKNYDSYTTFTVGIMYYFARVPCPEILKH